MHVHAEKRLKNCVLHLLRLLFSFRCPRATTAEGAGEADWTAHCSKCFYWYVVILLCTSAFITLTQFVMIYCTEDGMFEIFLLGSFKLGLSIHTEMHKHIYAY